MYTGGGLDTLADIGASTEVLEGGGTIHNLILTLGPEISLLGPLYIDAGLSVTCIDSECLGPSE